MLRIKIHTFILRENIVDMLMIFSIHMQKKLYSVKTSKAVLETNSV